MGGLLNLYDQTLADPATANINQQKLPAQLEGKLTKFLVELKALREQHKFLLDLIYQHG